MRLYIAIKKIRKCWKYGLVLLFAIILSRCISFDQVIQPDTVKAGETFTTNLKVAIKTQQQNLGAHLVIGILAPKSWHIGSTAELTYTSDRSADAKGVMELIPAGVAPNSGTLPWPETMLSMAGYGANKLRDMEWVAFWSDKTYDIRDGETINAKIDVTIRTGEQNEKVQLNYFVASSALALTGSFQPRWDTISAIVETVGGTGSTLNYLSPQLSDVAPSRAMDNDIIFIKFDGSLLPTALTGADKVFLCITAYTHDNEVINVCRQDAGTLMSPVGKDVWQLALWPRKYFNLSEGQSIDSIKYSFTNQSNDVTVTNLDTGMPFMYMFSCK